MQKSSHVNRENRVTWRFFVKYIQIQSETYTYVFRMDGNCGIVRIVRRKERFKWRKQKRLQ